MAIDITELYSENTHKVQAENGRENINDLDKLRVNGLVNEDILLEIINGQNKIVELLAKLLNKGWV